MKKIMITMLFSLMVGFSGYAAGESVTIEQETILEGSSTIEQETIAEGTATTGQITLPEALEDGDYHIRIEDGELVLLEEYSQENDTEEQQSPAYIPAEAMQVDLPDGEYSIELNMSGGSGKASIVSPTVLRVEEGKAYAHIQWSSANYDYMIVAGEKLLNQSEEGMNSTYDIPVLCMDDEMPVIADTTAMGTPHEVNYTLTFFSESVGSKSALPQEAAKRVILLALLIIVGGGILNHYVNKRGYT